MKIKKKFISFIIIALLCTGIIYSVTNISIYQIMKLPDCIYASYDDLEYMNECKEFGKVININYDDAVKVSKEDSITAKLRLFNIITIKSFRVNLQDIDLYVPGNAIGFTLKGKGVVMLGNNSIVTIEGPESALENSLLRKGDIILSIEGTEITCAEDINNIINKEENCGKILKVKASRENEIFETTITPKLEESTGIYKLGIWVKDSTSGVGTVTFIKKDDLRFGSLGHPITDSDTKGIYNIQSGQVYNCNVIGVTKGLKGRPGELKGLFLQGRDSQGEVDKNTEYGVYGHIKTDSNLIDSQILKAGGRFAARPGKAKIRVCVDGTESKDYDIEIIKTNYQSASTDKSMVIKVTDKELIKKTGGIVQGMSGSPIIQSGKVIGAITHVFVNDPTKGFGIYLDWMLNE